MLRKMVVWLGMLGLLLAACSQNVVVMPSTVTPLPAVPLAQPTSQPTAVLPTATMTATAVPTLANSPTPLPPTATLAPTAVPTRVNLTPLPASISGIVQSAQGPLAGAIVQIKGSPNKTTTLANGSFTLSGISGTTPISVTAWSQGYYVGWTDLNPSAPDWKGGQGFTITLKPLPEKDNVSYPWFSWEGVKGSASCGLCHREHKEWLTDAHSKSATNPRFLSIYTGNHVNGDLNQSIQWGGQGLPLPPDPSKPYYGPGFRLDTPNRGGNCATCHTPVASKVPNDTNCGWSGCHTDLTTERSRGVITASTLPIGTSGDGAEGITCDFCHKIGEVILDPHTRLPKPDMPGILSMKVYRPDEGQQIFFGPWVDVTRRVSYSPLQEKSEYCAACHYGVFGGVVGVGEVSGGVVVYNSYGEWLKSPYSNPKTGKTCQQCHMPALETKVSVFPEKGGIQRDYLSLHDHYMPGAADTKLLQNSVTMKTTATRVGNQMQVNVSITNDRVGHDIPTDAPMRQMILVVEAKDANGKLLTLVKGPLNPAHAGNFGGQPGKTFMKVLKDEWTGEAPTAAYWRPVSLVEDTRLPALATDTTQYTFDLPSGQNAQVSVRLVFRRNFEKLMKEKGWTDPDILMEEEIIQVAK